MTIVEITNKTNGRPIKFTSERIEQIKNLVERGKSREEIAEIINVTVGSLQVTCSRLGISLRRPKPRLQIAPFVPRLPSVERTLPAMPAVADKPCFGLVIQYKGKERVTDLPLTGDAVRQLALEAAFHGICIPELIGRLITSIVRRPRFFDDARAVTQSDLCVRPALDRGREPRPCQQQVTPAKCS